MVRYEDKMKGDALRDLLGCVRKWRMEKEESHTSEKDHLIINNKYMES